MTRPAPCPLDVRPALVALAAVLACLAPAVVADEGRLPLVTTEDFEQGADRWQPTDAQAWSLAQRDGGHVYSLDKKRSQYKPPHRSPYNIALLKDVVVGDFELTLKLLSTEPDYGHRSLCLFFGYQDPAHFYYVHLGKKTDNHANQIFIVNDAPRTKISTKTTPGTPWDDAWHTVRIVRDAAGGKIEVYFDLMDEPIMTANDKTFVWGQVGVGSFDDRGVFDRVELRGQQVERP